MPEGMRPAIKVKNILMSTKTNDATKGSSAPIFVIPDRLRIIMFVGMQRRRVVPIPIIPAAKPMTRVSALNTREISFLEAPIARSIPISFVLSRTEI